MSGDTEVQRVEYDIELQIACPACRSRDLIIKVTIAYNGELLAGRDAGIVHCTNCGHFWLDWKASYSVRYSVVERQT